VLFPQEEWPSMAIVIFFMNGNYGSYGSYENYGNALQ
jgi:hypothetical protein